MSTETVFWKTDKDRFAVYVELLSKLSFVPQERFLDSSVRLGQDLDSVPLEVVRWC